MTNECASLREATDQAFKDCLRLRELAARQTLRVSDNRDLAEIADRVHALAVSRIDTGYAEGAPTRAQLEWDAEACAKQRDDLRDRLDRVRAAAESDPDIPAPLRSFLLRETEPGWLHVPGFGALNEANRG